MAFIDFDNLKDRVVDLAQTGVAKSKQLAEVAKLKTANMGEEDTIKRAYVELGKLYYAECGMTPAGAYASACEKITAARAAIEANNDRIAEIRSTDDGADAEIVAEIVEEPAAPAEVPVMVETAAAEPVVEPVPAAEPVVAAEPAPAAESDPDIQEPKCEE